MAKRRRKWRGLKFAAVAVPALVLASHLPAAGFAGVVVLVFAAEYRVLRGRRHA